MYYSLPVSCSLCYNYSRVQTPVDYSRLHHSPLQHVAGGRLILICQRRPWRCSLISFLDTIIVWTSFLTHAGPMSFTQKLINLLRSSPESVQHAVLKSLHLLTKSGDSYIQTIIELNGMECLSQELTSSNETIQRISCSTITNLFDYDDDQLQTAMDGNLLSCLNDMLGIDKNKKQALWTTYILTKIGNVGQVKQLVTEGCVSHLCNILTSDCNTAIQAIWSLKNVSGSV